MIYYKDITKKKAKEFGVLIGCLLLIISLILNLKFDFNAVLFFITGLVLLFFGILFPQVLRGVTFVWMYFSLVLNRVTSPIIFFLFYFLLFFPYSLFLKLFKVKYLPLGKNIKWVNIDSEKISINYFRKQF